MFTAQFWMEALERALKSAAQSAVVVLGAAQVNVFEIDWQDVAGISAGMAVVSVLTSIASTSVGNHQSPSLVDEAPAAD